MTLTPPVQTLSGSLVGGFIILVIGLAALSFRRARHPLHSRTATTRALLYALIYGLASAAFARVIGAALTGQERSPWLLALSDVVFVTMGLYVLVMALVEGYSPRDYGFRPVPIARLALTMVMGVGVAIVYAFDAYVRIASHRVPVNADTLAFAALAATLGSSIPEETLFRGYLMSSLDGRTREWMRIGLTALAFAVVRGLRYAPGLVLGSQDWLAYVVGGALPLGLWWGLMRELAGGALWPSLFSHFLLEFGVALAGAPPALP